MEQKYATRALVMATLGMAVSFVIWGLIASQSTRFQEELGLTDAQTSWIIAIPVLLGSLFRIPMGMLTERYGGRIVFTLLMLFSVIPAIGLSQANTYAGVLFWGLFLGMAGTSFAIGIPLVSKWFPPEKQGLALGIYGVGNIGTAVANFTVPFLNRSIGPTLTFYLYAGIILVFSILFFLVVRDAKVGKKVTLRESVQVVTTTSSVWVLSTFYFLTFGSFVAMGNYLPKLLVDIFEITREDAGMRAAGFIVLATIFRPVGGYLADRWGGHQLLMIVFTIMVFSAATLAVFTAFYPVTIASLVLAMAAGVGNGAVFKLVPLYYPKQTGIVTGITGAAGGIGGFFPPLLMGTARQAWGTYSIGFVALALFAGFCLWLNWRNIRSRGKGEGDQKKNPFLQK